MPSTLVSEEGHWKGAVAGRRLAGRPAFWLLGVLALLPPSAMADEIPFYITNTTGISDANFLCKGPWLRVSPCGRVPETSDPVNFYNAEINLFSPFGLWECDLLREDACILLVSRGCNFVSTPSPTASTLSSSHTTAENLLL